MLVIVINHDRGFVGSRDIKTLETEDEKAAFLKREFPGLDFDDILFVKKDTIVEEWFGLDADARHEDF